MTLRRALKWRIFSLCGWFPYFGTRVFFPRNSGAFFVACQQGIYEHDNLRLVHALIQPGSTYFDVGANIGLMSAPILAQRDDCQVISFEPSPTAVPSLQRTVSGSRYSDRWQLVNKAVGAERGTAEFFTGSEGGALYDGLRDTNRAGQGNLQHVQITTLDDEWKRLERPRVSAIKIDVEGNELDVLNGARECIQAEHPSILMEWNAVNFASYHRKAGDLLEFAASVDYLVFAVPGFAPVENLQTLELHLLRTENFLLVPNKRLG